MPLAPRVLDRDVEVVATNEGIGDNSSKRRSTLRAPDASVDRCEFDVQAAYDPSTDAATPIAPASRATFVSALAVDRSGLSTLRKSGATATLKLPLDKLALPTGSVVTIIAVLLPGVTGGSFGATLRLGTGAKKSFQINDGVAMSNAGALGDGNPANALALSAATGGSPAVPATLTITKGNDAARLAQARDVLLWVEYNVP